MRKKAEVVIQNSKMTLFGRAREALAKVGINLEAIVETYSYFVKQQADVFDTLKRVHNSKKTS